MKQLVTAFVPGFDDLCDQLLVKKLNIVDGLTRQLSQLRYYLL